ncbi:MAG: class I SAM-dependent methyltransferase [Burkholderiaceae bacterium]|nr:class I SAM-dependent methyltransferase [Burkholderiaceae bacterium]
MLDAIPVLVDKPLVARTHWSGEAETRGRGAAELCAMIRDGRGFEALLDAITVPIVAPHRLRRLLPLPDSIWESEPLLRFGGWLRQRQLLSRLKKPRDAQSARDWLNLFYGRGSPLSGALYNYFFHRFTQPRYLAALSLFTLLPPSDKPVLDIATGFGHFAHHLQNGEVPHPVIGLDFNFFPMWAARRVMVPKASFVVADATEGLPFPDGAFSGVTCSDAFHFMAEKTRVLEECDRCVDNGPVIFTRVGNAQVLPPDGPVELSPGSYRALFAGKTLRMFGELDLVKSYLRHLGPDLSHDARPDELAFDKYLSIVVFPDGELPPRPSFERWPHCVGVLGINPLYAARPRADGGLDLSLGDMPSKWFALQNAAALMYLPQRTTITRADLDAMKSGQMTPALGALIDRFVVIGMPSGYATPRADRPSRSGPSNVHEESPVSAA